MSIKADLDLYECMDIFRNTGASLQADVALQSYSPVSKCLACLWLEH